MSRWLLISAGVGSEDFENSAKRVARQAEKFKFFSEIISLDTAGVSDVCRRVKKAFPHKFNPQERGFGFMTWKSEIVLSALEGFFGEFDGVLWVDGGCEVNANLLTEIRLKKILRLAEQRGVAAFTLETPELFFTKSDLMKRFNFVDAPGSISPQFQTTWFALSGEIGISIAREWLQVTLEDYAFSDVEVSRNGEVAGFVENRYDQSIFSLVCKRNGIKPLSYLPAAGNSGFRSEVRAAFHPIWTARNRQGNSIIPKWIRIIQHIRLR